MSMTTAEWAANAVEIYRSTGEAADFVITPADESAAITHENCKEVRGTTRVLTGTGVYIDAPVNRIHVPRLAAAVRPAEGDVAAYDGGTRFTIGQVRETAGVWIVEDIPA